MFSQQEKMMRVATVVVGSFVALGACATTSATQNPDPPKEEPLIVVSGGDPVFADEGVRAFPFAKRGAPRPSRGRSRILGTE
jgi:hypothetical protein